MQNALMCLSISRSEDELTGLSGYSPSEGTGHTGILKALAKIASTHPEVSPYVLSESRADVAILKLTSALQRGRPAILCVDGWGHWVAAVGVLGDTVMVCDSADNELILPTSPQDLLERWRASNKRKGFYGILL